MSKPRVQIFILALFLAGCSLRGTATPTPLADSFFFGRAFIDANGNGEVDINDPPLPQALFSASDSRGANGGGVTDEQGEAYAWWPGQTTWPVVLRIRPPDGYEPVGAAEVRLQSPNNRADFLFALQDKE